jgi:hypothetical protein
MFVEWLYDGLLNMGLSMELEDDPMMMSAWLRGICSEGWLDELQRALLLVLQWTLSLGFNMF